MTDFEIYDLKLVYFNLFCYYTFQLFVDPIWKPTKVGVWIITAFIAEALQNDVLKYIDIYKVNFVVLFDKMCMSMNRFLRSLVLFIM